MKSSKIRVSIVLITFILLNPLLFACSQHEGIEMGKSCTSEDSQVFIKGLYRSERGESGPYYSWSFIRFFEDCTYKSISTLSENLTKAARINIESENKKGVYSVEGSIIKMKSDINESMGQINGDTINLETYVFKTKKTVEKQYTYYPVHEIWEDLVDSIEVVEKEVE